MIQVPMPSDPPDAPSSALPQASIQPPIPISIDTSSTPRKGTPAKRTLARSYWGWLVIALVLTALLIFILREGASNFPTKVFEPEEIRARLLAIPLALLGTLILLFLILPLVLPLFLAQHGCLSVGRWASLAAFCLTASIGVISIASILNSLVTGMFLGIVVFLLYGAALGCLLASAFYPKGNP
jgi:hypothetical protein